jgi:hypothetical protein
MVAAGVTGPLAVGDFTGNGKLDLATAKYFTDNVSVLLGNGDGTFQPEATSYPVGFHPGAIVAGDFMGSGHVDLAVANEGNSTVSVLLGNGDGTFQPAQVYAVGQTPHSVTAGDFTGDGKRDLATANYYSSDVSLLLANLNGAFSDPAKLVTTPQASPLLADINGDGIDDVLVVDGAGDILYRQGIPGEPGSFEPPITVNPPLPGGSNPYTSRDIAWLPNTDQGPVLASVDAKDNNITFYAYRAGNFVRLSGSLTTGQFPAQIVAADLNGAGQTDLVVRNAADGSLSLYYATTLSAIGFTGPVSSLAAPTFLPPVTLPVGVGVSDVQAVDTTGNGALDLVVTNKLTAQVSILRNEGDGLFAAPVPYRAGTGLSAIDPGNTPDVTSPEATAGMAAGPLAPGGPTNLVTIDAGSSTLDVLAGLGGGRFANPVTIQTSGTPQVVRMGDFTGNGIDDLAVLTADGLSVYLGDGKGGFLPPTTYAVPAESHGLAVADFTGDGKLDLLVGDAYGDVLLLSGKGDGTFEPYHEASQSIELAVADLTGNGSKDVIYADQGLDRVVVDYGAGNSSILADQSTGLLQPGAVQLAYLAGPSYPPDLIVANSGSNNVLIYPGLGNGQFGPAVNGGHGYFVGTNPVGITVANLTGSLPDLVVADKGSNQVSILLNNSQGGNISFEPGPRLNSGGVGPVSTVVGNFTPGSPNQDILVANSGSNNVALLPGVGQGFFNDINPQTFAVGANPGPLFVGNFNGNTDLLTVNAGSNNLTLISDFMGADAVTVTLPSDGTDPVTAFSFSSGSGFDDLVVGNGGDGVLALFEGSNQGLTPTSTETSPDLPSPSALVYAGVGGGEVQFYGATVGSEAAALVALSVGGEIGPLPAPAGSATLVVAQLMPIQESSLALVGTLLIATIEPQGGEAHLGAVESEAEALALSTSSAAPLGVGQALNVAGLGGETGAGADALSANPEAAPAGVPAPTSLPSWQKLLLRPEEAIQKFNREHPELFPSSGDEQPEPNPTGAESQSPAPAQPVRPTTQSTSTPAEARLATIDRAIEILEGPDHVALEYSRGAERPSAAPWRLSVAVPYAPVQRAVQELFAQAGPVGVPTQHFEQFGQYPTLQNAKRERRLQVVASLALAATAVAGFYVHAADRRARKRPLLDGPHRWPAPRQ